MALDTARPPYISARRLDKQADNVESIDAWRRVHRLGQIVGASAIVGRPDWAEQASGELIDFARRRLRVLNGGIGNDAA